MLTIAVYCISFWSRVFHGNESTNCAANDIRASRKVIGCLLSRPMFTVRGKSFSFRVVHATVGTHVIQNSECAELVGILQWTAFLRSCGEIESCRIFERENLCEKRCLSDFSIEQQFLQRKCKWQFSFGAYRMFFMNSPSLHEVDDPPYLIQNNKSSRIF